jgi:hypothetical protein
MSHTGDEAPRPQPVGATGLQYDFSSAPSGAPAVAGGGGGGTSPPEPEAAAAAEEVLVTEHSLETFLASLKLGAQAARIFAHVGGLGMAAPNSVLPQVLVDALGSHGLEATGTAPPPQPKTLRPLEAARIVRAAHANVAAGEHPLSTPPPDGGCAACSYVLRSGEPAASATDFLVEAKLSRWSEELLTRGGLTLYDVPHVSDEQVRRRLPACLPATRTPSAGQDVPSYRWACCLLSSPRPLLLPAHLRLSLPAR